jgi:hypothetical protein
MSKLELMSGPGVEETLKSDDVKVFRYVVNNPGLYLIIGIGLVFYGLAGLTYWETQLSQTVWSVAFFSLLIVGTGFNALAAYWHQFAGQNVVAVSDDKLYVGGPKKLWGIDWELLDRESAGFDEMELSRLRGALQLQVGGQKIKLHLFNAIAYLDDIEGLMFRLLSQIKAQEEPDE